MKYLMTLLALVFAVTAGAQTDCSLQYDGDGNGSVDSMDLLGLLAEYAETCEPAFACGTPVLFDDYCYQTVQIGEQCWFKENLRNDNYANGDAIPGNLSDSEWSTTTSGAQAVYGEGASIVYGGSDDEAANLATYGRLYNWYAVDDTRGLCPSGWHVPTDGEWMTLEMELGLSFSEANTNGGRGTDQGTQMKSSPSDTPSWTGTNTSGFSALPSGWRYSMSGSFHDEGSNCGLWSANISPNNSSSALSRELFTFAVQVYRYNNPKRLGFSVRCVRD